MSDTSFILYLHILKLFLILKLTLCVVNVILFLVFSPFLWKVPCALQMGKKKKLSTSSSWESKESSHRRRKHWNTIWRNYRNLSSEQEFKDWKAEETACIKTKTYERILFAVKNYLWLVCRPWRAFLEGQNKKVGFLYTQNCY